MNRATLPHGLFRDIVATSWHHQLPLLALTTTVFLLEVVALEMQRRVVLMDLCSHLQIAAALMPGGWWVLHAELEIGGVVAFISGVGRLNDPCGDLVNYFREANLAQVKFRLLANALNQSVARPPLAAAARNP